jgi:hypothetical protein
MTGHDSERQEKKVALEAWADRYTTAFDQTLTTAWPDLADRLEQGISTLTLYELATGPGKPFKEGSIRPAVEAWVERHVKRLREKAESEFRNIVEAEAEPLPDDVPGDVDVGGTLEPTDVVKGLALPGGLLLGGGAVGVAITSTTTWLVFTTVVVSWPLLIGGLALGLLLSGFGVYNLSRLKQGLQDRFRKRLLPAIENAVIGTGIEHEGKHVASLKDQLIHEVKHAAAEARQKLDNEG